ncbi:MAG: nicotinamide-nucleotide adenylyltransferase [Thaumarchaeota archaeon]|nr:nicotinamide-nucleotide adenylyltransferase [Nitrososphaerota archaeon]
MNGMLVGRFQPFHLGHLEALRFALSQVTQLWLCIGSSNISQTKSNPFSYEERKKMVLASVDDFMESRLDIFPIPDVGDHQKWAKMIKNIIPEFDVVFTNDSLTRHIYLRQNVDVIPIPFADRESLSGTHIRGLIAGDLKWDHLVPAGTKKFLLDSGAKQRLKNL